jgi:regulator of ribosome biosynthesis
MDVSSILAAAQQPTTVTKDIPLEIDEGLLLVSDLNPIDPESYNGNLQDHLQSLARDGIQVLINSLFSLPTQSSEDGPLAQLPAAKMKLPRSKPLPKAKPKTKWELFAAAKGIQHKKRDKKVWDEEKQEWVNRWGKDGKNKELESQWLTEVPLNAGMFFVFLYTYITVQLVDYIFLDPDYDPRKVARDERKARTAKNEKQRLANVARAQGEASTSAAPVSRDVRKKEIDKTLAASRVSTASMGKFDKKLEGEKKLRGVKRKV